MQSTTIRLGKQRLKNGKVYSSGSRSCAGRLIVVEIEKKKEDEEPDDYAFIVPNRGVGQGAEHVDGL